MYDRELGEAVPSEVNPKCSEVYLDNALWWLLRGVLVSVRRGDPVPNEVMDGAHAAWMTLRALVVREARTLPVLAAGDLARLEELIYG